ncbi:AAA-like domain-containing protein [Chamaesiphon minutus]|uniref:WD40 repeat-containing protein n=1 Tax=Chamaesiphon minutus (strain ATCC 27169 / PCC 6605) TaxID=1173020 RepID=K9U9M1_CHAP6|nr:AAA-like domain-containing protein [Chamaesiphon minutus]AFY91777.1 WD40 repeat-containing protein [Chamaesiphon minutus PCC 6605]
MLEREPYEYRVGGSLPEHAPSYAIRRADRDFYDGLKAGDFCYVFNSRQMGKTSLLVRTLHRLRGEGVACTTIDVSGRGSGNIQPEQWYAGIAYTLVKDFKLANPLQFMKSWWQERDFLPPPQRLAEFIETVLLPNTTTPLAIFIDEIDSTLSLDFSTDDFFAIIRSCYDRRATNPDYQRLTFALIGVATPSDLIADKRRTPFNVGRAIELTGFTLAEASPLAIGLMELTDNPQATLANILEWTGGQPFLTQKLCYLLTQSNLFVRSNDAVAVIKKLVQAEILEDWESKDNPPHFKTIAARLTASETRSSSLLGLYRQILTDRSISIDNLPEERELQLSGITVKFGDRLRVANPIYAEIFNRSWVDKQLASFRPYGTAVKEWLESNKQDNSRLLRGKALEDALTWSKGKNLSNIDSQFLSTCREQRIYEANQEVLQQRIKQLWLLSGIAILFAFSALYLGAEARREKEKAQIATITAKNALNQALIKSDNSKHTLETLIGTLEAAKLLLNDPDRQLQPETETNLQYSLYGTLERNRLTHQNTVTGVNYSSDGKFIASVSKDRSLKIWQPDGKEIIVIPHSQSLKDLAISTDSKKIVTVGDDNRVRIWNIEGKQVTPTLAPYERRDKFLRVAITQDAKYIAAATNTDSQNAEIVIWEVKSGKIMKVLAFPKTPGEVGDRTHSFRDLKFSVDGKFLAAASTDTTIKVWAWQTSKSPQILTGHQDWAYSLSFRQDGKWLVSSGGGSDKSLKIWQIKAGEFKLYKTLEKIHEEGFYVAFNPNNRELATAGGTLKIWDFDRILAYSRSTINANDWGNILLAHISSNQTEYKSISYSPDGRRIALAATDSQVIIWEPDRALERNVSASDLSIKRVTYSNNGKYLATAGSDKQIRIWTADGRLFRTISGHKDWVYGLSFSPDDRSIASASEDNTIKIWQVADGKLVRTLKHNDFALDVSFSPDKRYLASVGNDEKIKIWDVRDGKLVTEIKITNNDHWIWKVTFSPDGRYLAANSTNGVELYRTSDFTKVRTLDDNNRQKMQSLLKISFSPDSKTIAASGVDGLFRWWSIPDGKSLAKYQAHQAASDDVQFSPDSQEIATSGGGTIKFWSRKGELRRTIESFNALSLAFSPDGKTFVAVDKNGVMRFWNLARLERVYLSLDASYAKGCERLQEYLAGIRTQRDRNSVSIDSICNP